MPIVIKVLIVVLSCLLALLVIGGILVWVDETKKKSLDKTKELNRSARYHNIYTTKDGKADYVFRYVLEPFDRFYYIDILFQPSYNDRCSSAHVTHRLGGITPGCRYRVCVYDHKAPKTLEEAMNLSMQWAELTHRYIRTGTTIDEQIKYNS